MDIRMKFAAVQQRKQLHQYWVHQYGYFPEDYVNPTIAATIDKIRNYPLKEEKMNLKKVCITHEYPENCQKIISVFEKHGYLLEQDQAEFLWQIVSEGNCNSSGWSSIPDNDDIIWEMAKGYWKEINS